MKIGSNKTVNGNGIRTIAFYALAAGVGFIAAFSLFHAGGLISKYASPQLAFADDRFLDRSQDVCTRQCWCSGSTGGFAPERVYAEGHNVPRNRVTTCTGGVVCVRCVGASAGEAGACP